MLQPSWTVSTLLRAESNVQSIGYPVGAYVAQHRPKFYGYNIGGINSTGQVPAMGNFGLIDQDTPRDALKHTSWRNPGDEWSLVFSDEFNTEGRSFYPGDDPYWEAVDLHYWVRGLSRTSKR